jgi:hypothetical protein
MIDARSSFNRQAQSQHGSAENFLFGSSSKLDKLSVDKKLINCADTMVKKEDRWKSQVAYENRCLGLEGAADDRSNGAPAFMQSAIWAAEASPQFQDPMRVSKEKHTSYVYRDMPMMRDSLEQTVNNRVLPLRTYKAPMPSLALQRVGVHSLPKNLGGGPAAIDRPATDRSQGGMKSNRSSARQQQQVQSWIMEEFGRCGDELLTQIKDANTIITSNREKMENMMDSIGKLETETGGSKYFSSKK